MCMNIKKIRCPKCNSEQGYSRIKTSDRVCRNCGTAYKPEIIQGEKGNEQTQTS
jgi:transcription initiation factor TFIIIB Brf1 subunit/transcription initiation factor TFIIB